MSALPESPLWRWGELCEALGLPLADGPDVTGISIDSRKTRPGDLFIALTGDPGSRFNPSQRSDRDGHDFIAAAIANGAVGVLVHDGRQHGVAQLDVADTLDALWALGAAARARLQCPVVAVTGSSGKTTVKGFLTAATGGFATAGSLNNHLGVPLSLALTPRQAPAATFEIGTNHPGEIAPLSRLVQPDVAVVLNVHPAHRANFASMAQLMQEKLSIAEGLGAKGNLVIEESLTGERVPEGVRVTRFGRGAEARVRLLELHQRHASFELDGQRLTAHVPGGGEHRAMSLAAVLGVLAVLGLDLTPGLSLADTLIPAGRGQEHQVAGIVVIDDSYNANPASMKAALLGLQGRPERRRFALLGEMLELGEESADFHRGLAALAGSLDGVFCVGAGMESLHAALPPERRLGYQAQPDDALLARLAATLGAGDVLLVKGSNRVFWARGYVGRVLEALSAAGR
ncbi:MAG: UDP-N-acetylmuramoyl-tripeptide--D-alanyl-D-alanine ligase [Pseudomonadales bacterium]